MGTCEPRGDSKDMVSMQRSLQSKNYRRALQTAENLIARGFVNIQAHVVCSQAYEGLNEPEKAKFHHDIAASLIRSILATGDGKTKESGFEVIGRPNTGRRIEGNSIAAVRKPERRLSPALRIYISLPSAGLPDPISDSIPLPC